MRAHSHVVGNDAVGLRDVASRGADIAWRRWAAWRCLLVLMLLAWTTQAFAETRAWLDRNRIAYDESVTLTIEIDGSMRAQMPDIRALADDFLVIDQSSHSNMTLVNGSMGLSARIVLTLQPKREGELLIPMFDIGGERTQPLRLMVTPPKQSATPSATDAMAGQAVFLESMLDPGPAYVQQSLGYTVRLYYDDARLIEGRLDQESPEGANLRKLGEDVMLSRDIGGRRYKVIERRYLVIPERAGALSIPGARFTGRTTSSLFDDMWGGGGAETHAVRSASIPLQVRPIPADAPQPWLPLRGLTLRAVEAPSRARVGESTAFDVELVADGATRTQLPELTLPALPGAQVFPEPVRVEERFVDGRPQTTLRRRFSIVPERVGTLQVPGPRVIWWDAQAGQVREATIPAQTITVASGATAQVRPGGARTTDATSADDTGNAARGGWWASRWAWLAIALLLLWAATLYWLWRVQRQRRIQAAVADLAGGLAPGASPHRPAGSPERTMPPDAPPPIDPGAPPRTASWPVSSSVRSAPPAASDWRAAATAGDLVALGRTLCAMVTPPAGDLDALSARLDDPRQRDAIVRLQRARWAGDDARAACDAVLAAFASGPRWRTTPPARGDAPELPPLYPQG